MSARTCPNCKSCEICSIDGTNECQSCGWLSDGGLDAEGWKYLAWDREWNG